MLLLVFQRGQPSTFHRVAKPNLWAFPSRPCPRSFCPDSPQGTSTREHQPRMHLVQDSQTELYPELQHPGQPSPGVNKVQLPPAGLNDSVSSVKLPNPITGLPGHLLGPILRERKRCWVLLEVLDKARKVSSLVIMRSPVVATLPPRILQYMSS